jgi:hypothetical protein
LPCTWITCATLHLSASFSLHFSPLLCITMLLYALSYFALSLKALQCLYVSLTDCVYWQHLVLSYPALLLCFIVLCIFSYLPCSVLHCSSLASVVIACSASPQHAFLYLNLLLLCINMLCLTLRCHTTTIMCHSLPCQSLFFLCLAHNMHVQYCLAFS